MGNPDWAAPAGLPTAHALRAAIHVAAILDARGSAMQDARESYWRHATGGLFALPDLETGEQLLVDCGLVERRGQTLYPLPELERLLDGEMEDAAAAICVRAVDIAVPVEGDHGSELDRELGALISDPKRREDLLVALGRRFEDSRVCLIGAIGEEVTVASARAELLDLGYDDLARRVRHVSMETDQAGYDISAPRVAGGMRLLEVKTTTSHASEVCVVVSRNEAETGLRLRDWSLVLCRVSDIERREGEVIGWCLASELEPSLPGDNARGRWQTAEITLKLDDLNPGLPSAAT